MAESEQSAREAMEKSRIEVMECEEEIKSIKNSLKAITMGAASGGEASLNHLEVSVQNVKALERSDTESTLPTTFKVHLSSPIEERTITKLYDPLNPTAEEGLAKFESVEISNALLTVEAFYTSGDESGEKKLGVSAPHDLLPLCQGGEKKSSMLDIAIVAEKGIDEVETMEEETNKGASEAEEKVMKKQGSEYFEAATDEEDLKEEEEEKEKVTTEEVAEDAETTEDEKKEVQEKEDEAAEETKSTDQPAQDESKTSELQLPLYTLTIELEYTPSAEDKRDALYVQLNEVSKRKVAAIESLRKNAGLVNRAKAAEASSSIPESPTKKSPAVQSGFLNKSKPTAEASPPFWKRWYEKTIGPKAMLWTVGPIAKNYVIFVGISLFIHFKGDLLALPAPV